MAKTSTTSIAEGLGWQDDFRLRDDLLQPEVYAFEKALQRMGGLSMALVGGGTVHATHAICAAIEAGWIAEPETGMADYTPSPNGAQNPEKMKQYFIGDKGIHEMTAGEVIWYGSKVTEAYRDATTIPKN